MGSGEVHWSLLTKMSLFSDSQVWNEDGYYTIYIYIYIYIYVHTYILVRTYQLLQLVLEFKVI